MNVLQITSALYFGGGERHVVDLSQGLPGCSHDVFVAIRPSALIRAQLPFLPDSHLFELPFRGQFDLLTARSLANLIAAKKIDLIHAHAARDYVIAAMAARFANVPYVITRHVLFPMSKLHRFFLSDARFVIAPSEAVANGLREQNIFPSERIVTIGHGLPTDPPLAKKRNKNEAFVVGAIGNLDPVKGFDVLIRAAALVIKEIPGVRFEIAGDDRDSAGENKRDLRDLIAALRLDENVKLTGWAPDIHETLAGFDLFVSSSRSESFGYVLAEAMLAGVPVVATETEGAREVVGDAGRLVPIGSPEALAGGIIEMLKSHDLRETASNRGRTRIIETFSMERMLTETAELYQQALKSR